MSAKLLTEHHLEFISLKSRLHWLVYTCQNATLLIITCHGSYVLIVSPLYLGVCRTNFHFKEPIVLTF